MPRLGELNPTPLAILISAVLACLLIVSGTSVWRLEQTRSDARLSRDIREASADCMEGALDAETRQRGFLLTGREDYLAPRGERAMAGGAVIDRRQIDRLETLTRELPEPHARALELRRVLDEKSSELERTIELERAGKHDLAMAIVDGDRGRQLMDRAHVIVDELRGAEIRRHDQRLADLRRGFLISLGIDVGAGVAALILGGLLVGINRDIRRRQELEAVLRRHVSAERRDAHRAAFLTRAAGELGSSLEYETTLRTVAQLAVPEFADWCAVDLLDEGKVRRLAVAHADPAKIALVGEIERRYPSDPNSTTGVPNILRTGEPEFLADLPAALLDGAARDDEHLRLIRSLGLRSYIGAPLKVRGQTIGVITFVLAETNRTYEAADLTAALELCDRAATAIEHARLYAESQRLRREAELANRAKDEFLAMLGHELRNPLAPIVTALHLVRERGGPRIEEELAVIDRQLRHMVRLVDDLLDVSRITRGRLELQRQPVDLADVMAHATELSRPLLDERRHQLTIDAQPGLMVSGDAVRLAQIMNNLLTNAAKYTDAGGRIEVSARRDGERIAIRVRDNGIGVPADVLPHVFDLFVQEAQSIDRSKGGLGLGLAIVRSLTLAHDGEVSARSDGVGQGSEFVVMLPALDPTTLPAPSAALPSPTTPPTPSADRQPTRLLVVDDNVDAAELLTESMALLGYDAHKALDAESALLLAAQLKPSVALLDLGLPVIDGYELAWRLRGIDGLAQIRLIAVTGYGQPSDRDRSRAAGFDAHLVKPVSIEAVRRAIEQAE